MLTNFGSTQKKPAASAPKRKNVQVVVRTRPISEAERAQKQHNIVACDSVSKIVALKTSMNDKHYNANLGQRTFGPFDKAFGPETTQIHMYNEVVAPLMKEVLNGYNCTVFAYGQTGSGKTYTMEGRHDDSSEYTWDTDPTSGIIPRALHQIFTELGKDDIDFTVRASYVELYNEQIYDLLSTSSSSQFESLRIFDDKTKGVLIAGAEEVVVRTRDEVYDLLRRGAEKRRTAATLMNMTSSRSHSVFTVSVMIRETGLINGEELLRQGKLNLVDLAGSENIGRSGATEQRAREAGQINTSLLALGRVINALTMNAGHIPYRESKLTRILQDSLGGKTITTIIATISPASSNLEESVNTLEYAQRAKNIKNNPEVNQKITRRGLLKEYNDEIERLRRDLLAAREKHGIYLDKENYDNMEKTIKEQSSKVEDLEGQLSGQMQRVKTLLEDFAFMDSHYQAVYDKCCAALNKLEKRKIEVEHLNKDLALTNDNLKAANKALNLSENSFVRLRAQAYKFQNSCANFYQDLGVLHDKMDSMKQIFSDNDQMLANLVAEETANLADGNSQISSFAHSSMDRMNKAQNIIAEIDGQTENYSTHTLRYYKDLDKKAADFHKLALKTLAEFNVESGSTTNKFMSSSKETIKSALLLNEEMSTKLVESLEKINELQKCCNSQRDQIGKMVDQAVNMNKQRGADLEKFVAMQLNSLNEERNLLASINQTAGQLNTDVVNKSKQLGEFQREQLNKVQASNQNAINYDALCDQFAAGTQKTADAFQKKMSADINDHANDCQNLVAHLTAKAKELANVVHSTIKSVHSVINDEKTSTETMAQQLTSKLNESIKDIEHFIQQEYKRIQATGSTPDRRQTASFMEDLVDLPPAQKLFEEQRNLVTPRRTSLFRARDSILDAPEFRSALVSPNTLKDNLPGQKVDKLETVEEEDKASSMRSSTNSMNHAQK